MLKNKRIGVMLGGLSAERDISRKSGQAVFRALKGAGLDVVVLDVVKETEGEIRQLITSHAVDVVFIAMHGGFGEDGRLQHILKDMHVSFTGCREKASRLAMDKVASHKLFEDTGLTVPKYEVIENISQQLVLNSLHCPLVVKPATQGSSIGVSFVDEPSRLNDALKSAFKYGKQVLVEEFIKGREITVSVLDGHALPIVEIIPKKQFFDFQAKYEKGLTDYVVPASFDAELTREIKKNAVCAYRALGCTHLSRVDMIISDNALAYILEVNTIPGMTETSLFPKAAKAAGLSFEQLCFKLIELVLNTSDNGKE